MVNSGLRLAFALLCACVAGGPLLLLSAASRPAAAKTTIARADYTHALAAADLFLQAWQGGDLEKGLVLLTSRVKAKSTREDLSRFFASPATAAYEIERGKLVRRGRYEFPVILMTAARQPQRRISRIVVVDTGNNDWAVDKLP